MTRGAPAYLPNPQDVNRRTQRNARRKKKRRRRRAKYPLGTGQRFAALKGELARGGARNPGGLAAYIGRQKYGKKRFAQLSRRRG